MNLQAYLDQRGLLPQLPGLFADDGGPGAGGGAEGGDEAEPDQPDKGGEGAGNEGGETDWKAEAEKWKAFSRKHEGQAKANADAAKRLAEIEEASKSEAEKITERAATAEKAAAERAAELARLRVAMRKGLTETQAKRLIGDTEEALEADADELLASFQREEAEESKGGTPRSRPKEKLKSGNTGGGDKQSDDPQQRARDYYADAKTK